MASGAEPREFDLTGRARIRNAALELFAARGIGGTSMRQVADRAGVTVGLVTHHFGTKESLRKAVDDYVIERYTEVLTAVPGRADPHELFAARDAAVTEMLREDLSLQNYLRLTFLNPSDTNHDLLERLIDFSVGELRRLRALGVVSSARSEEDQVVSGVVQQLGALLLAPLLERSWRHLGGAPASAPAIRVGTTRVGGVPESHPADRRVLGADEHA